MNRISSKNNMHESDRLDGIRDGNSIPDNLIFTLNGTEINKTQEKNFSIKDILDNNTNSIFLKNIKPKKKY